MGGKACAAGLRLWCAAAALLFGAATPAIKPLLDHAGSVVVAGLLYLGAALAAAPFGRRRAAGAVPSEQRWRLLGAVAPARQRVARRAT